MSSADKKVRLKGGTVVRADTLDRWKQEAKDHRDDSRKPLAGMFLEAERRKQRRARRVRAQERAEGATAEAAKLLEQGLLRGPPQAFLAATAIHRAKEELIDESPAKLFLDETAVVPKGAWEALRPADEVVVTPDWDYVEEKYSTTWAEEQKELQAMLRARARLEFMKAGALALVGLGILGSGAAFLWGLYHGGH